MNILVACALSEERADYDFSGAHVRVVETKVGKAAAAFRLTRAICESRPDCVLNIGTAGTLKHRVGDVLISHRFVDRDFECLKLPGIVYELETELPSVISNWKATVQGADFIVNTGDDFVTQGENITGDVIDMEGYAEALVCQELGIPFASIKYVTDVIGQNSVKHWENKLEEARSALSLYIKEQQHEK